MPRVTSNVELLFGAPPETDPLIVATLVDYASEISEDPKQEFLLLVAHGPEAEADNEVVLGLLEELAVDVQNSVGFAAVGVSLVTSVLTTRAPGMSMRRVPPFAWSAMVSPHAPGAQWPAWIRARASDTKPSLPSNMA